MKGPFLAIFIIILSISALDTAVDIARKNAHAGYYSRYGAIEWGFVAVAWILVIVAW